tara:strand:+ start:106 stop:276 length:171 start_codon:yes stop_codon:yes gene_type:complete
MHCSNPNCCDDECDGGCRKPRELGQEMDWPWYRYEGNVMEKEEATAKEAEAKQGLS